MGTAVDQLENGLAQPLLLHEENKEISEEGEDGDDSEDATSEDSHKPANSFGSAYRLLTPSVKVCFLLILLYSPFFLLCLWEGFYAYPAKMSNILMQPYHVISHYSASCFLLVCILVFKLQAK